MGRDPCSTVQHMDRVGHRGCLVTHMRAGRGVPFTQSPWQSLRRRRHPGASNKLWCWGAQMFTSSKPSPVSLGQAPELPGRGPPPAELWGLRDQVARVGCLMPVFPFFLWMETEGSRNNQRTLNASWAIWEEGAGRGQGTGDFIHGACTILLTSTLLIRSNSPETLTKAQRNHP